MSEPAPPLVRVKPKDLIAAAVQRVPRVGGVRDGLPLLDDGRVLDVRIVIWCTGFRTGFSWIALPILGDRQEPTHERGVVPNQPGLFFVGCSPVLGDLRDDHGLPRDAAHRQARRGAHVGAGRRARCRRRRGAARREHGRLRRHRRRDDPLAST